MFKSSVILATFIIYLVISIATFLHARDCIHCQHFVVHGPSCKESMKYDLLEMQTLSVTPCTMGIPWAHIVTVSWDPTKYDLTEVG